MTHFSLRNGDFRWGGSDTTCGCPYGIHRSRELTEQENTIGQTREGFSMKDAFESADTRTYKVVVNHEEQYSIWAATGNPPAGWREDGKVGSKAECLQHIHEVWTDMRPLSVRRQKEPIERSS